MLCMSAELHSFSCAFGLKTLGDLEQQGRDKIVTLVLKILRKFLVENERQSFFKEFLKPFLC